MAKILVVDPLDLCVEDEGSGKSWTSKSCFVESLANSSGVIFEYTTASDERFCDRARGMDGVILGGSAASAWEDNAFNDAFLDLIAICRHDRIPFLGICYGAQLLGRALGARVGRHPEGLEVGTTSVRISQKGKQHFLFKGFAESRFEVVEAHQDAVLTLPPESELLASTAHTPVQAFSFNGLLTGVQFHPEMSGDDLRALWVAFDRKGWLSESLRLKAAEVEQCDCPRYPQILLNFVDWVASEGAHSQAGLANGSRGSGSTVA